MATEDDTVKALMGLQNHYPLPTAEEMFAEIHETSKYVNTNYSDFSADVIDDLPITAEPLQEPLQEHTANETSSNGNVEPATEICIEINNVVCSFSVRCHINLKHVAMEGMNVEYKKENAMVTMRLRKPYTTASIWSSGKVTVTGATSEEAAKIAARRYARILQKLGYRVRLANLRIVNVLGTCAFPWPIQIAKFSAKHRTLASYEPELHPGVTYRMNNLKAVLKIFSTGSITVTAPSVANVQAAITDIFPLVYEYSVVDAEEAKRIKSAAAQQSVPQKVLFPLKKRKRVTPSQTQSGNKRQHQPNAESSDESCDTDDSLH